MISQERYWRIARKVSHTQLPCGIVKHFNQVFILILRIWEQGHTVGDTDGEVNTDWLWTHERERHKPKLCSLKEDHGDGCTRAQEATRAQGKGRCSSRDIYKHWNKRHAISWLKSDQKAAAPWFPHNFKASWDDAIGSKVLRTHLIPFLLGLESCPWTRTPQFGPCCLLLIRSIRWFQPAYASLLLFVSDPYSNFNDNCNLLETSMSSLLWLAIIFTETSCDCLAWTRSPVGALGPTTTQVAAQGGPKRKACFFQTILLTCSKEAWGVTLQEVQWVAKGFWGAGEREKGRASLKLGSPLVLEQNLPCTVMVRMLTALSALCLWKGSLCSSQWSTDRFWDSRLVCSSRCGYKRRHGGLSKGRGDLSSKLDKLVQCHMQRRCSTHFNFMACQRCSFLNSHLIDKRNMVWTFILLTYAHF